MEPEVKTIETTWKTQRYKPKSCATCAFLNTCTPCPLLTRVEPVSECSAALQAIKGYNASVQHWPLQKAFDVYVRSTDDGQFVIAHAGKEFKLSNSGFMIWEGIVNNRTIHDVAGDIRDHISNISEEEIMQFVHDLRRIGLVSFENDYPTQLPIDCILICCAR